MVFNTETGRAQVGHAAGPRIRYEEPGSVRQCGNRHRSGSNVYGRQERDCRVAVDVDVGRIEYTDGVAAAVSYVKANQGRVEVGEGRLHTEGNRADHAVVVGINDVQSAGIYPITLSHNEDVTSGDAGGDGTGGDEDRVQGYS